jgi:hypothetical protein
MTCASLLRQWMSHEHSMVRKLQWASFSTDTCITCLSKYPYSLTAQSSHTHSYLACILQQITTKASPFIEINSLQWHVLNQFWASSKYIHCSQQHIDSNEHSPSWKINCCSSRNLHDLKLQWPWMLRWQPSVMWLGKEVPTFKGIFSSTLKMEAACSSRMFEATTLQCHIPEYCDLSCETAHLLWNL